MNRAVYATAAEQRRIGGIDDGIDCQGGNVGLNDTQDSGHIGIGRCSGLSRGSMNAFRAPGNRDA
jgi:hypothetical protein